MPPTGTDEGGSDARDTGPAGGSRLSHLDESGTARMVDVGAKPTTKRRAVAAGTFRTTAEVIGHLSESRLPKGDVLATARIEAGWAGPPTATGSAS